MLPSRSDYFCLYYSVGVHGKFTFYTRFNFKILLKGGRAEVKSAQATTVNPGIPDTKKNTHAVMASHPETNNIGAAEQRDLQHKYYKSNGDVYVSKMTV